MTSRRGFFASVVGLGIARSDRGPDRQVKTSQMPAMAELRRLAEDLDRMEADRARMKADSDASWKRHEAWWERMKSYYPDLT